MAASCNFISLGEKMRKLLDKNGKREKKEKKGKEENYWSLDWTKKGAKFARCLAVFLGEAEWKLTKLVQSFNRSTRCERRSTIFGQFL